LYGIPLKCALVAYSCLQCRDAAKGGSVTSYFGPCEAKRRLQGTLALRRYQGAMPPRKRAAHLKKLADAKVAKVAKEESQVTAVRSLLSVFCSAISFT
jgi:hypothetical protein